MEPTVNKLRTPPPRELWHHLPDEPKEP
jgi:hypothetical protein